MCTEHGWCSQLNICSQSSRHIRRSFWIPKMLFPLGTYTAKPAIDFTLFKPELSWLIVANCVVVQGSQVLAQYQKQQRRFVSTFTCACAPTARINAAKAECTAMSGISLLCPGQPPKDWPATRWAAAAAAARYHTRIHYT